MTENDPAALHAEFAGRLKEAEARRDAELATLDSGYSAVLATRTPDLTAAHDRYAAARAAAALGHTEAISSIQDDYAQQARFGAPPLAAVAPAREGYPTPSAPVATTDRRAAASSKPGRNRSKQPSKAVPFGKKPTPVWRIAAMSVGGVLAVVAVLVGALFVASNINSRPAAESPPSSSGSFSNALPEVVYEVEGTAAVANITYTTSSGIAQQSSVKVPLTAKGGSQRGITFTMDRGDVVSISSQNRGSSGSLTCRITVDGVVVSTNTSSGAYTIATCSGSVP